MKYSLLDLSPIPEGGTARDAILNTVALAQAAEKAGYHRYWLAEHHNMPGIASAATSLVIAQVAAATTHMRVGAGGVMLPNDAPLVIAEQFGTLATLYPDRIDLGLGRAPGSDMATARALRRHMTPDDTFPQDVQELISYLSVHGSDSSVQAIPGHGTQVPVWILGSSLFGAQLAAYLGLPYAFASHFAPDLLEQALHIYRSTFQPSQHLDAPHAMLAAGVCVAPTDEEAKVLRSSQVLAFARLRTGRPGPLPVPVDAIEEHVPAGVLQQVQHALSCSATGAPETVHKRLSEIIARYQPDEIMLTGAIHDNASRIRSFEHAAEIMNAL